MVRVHREWRSSRSSAEALFAAKAVSGIFIRMHRIRDLSGLLARAWRSCVDNDGYSVAI